MNTSDGMPESKNNKGKRMLRKNLRKESKDHSRRLKRVKIKIRKSNYKKKVSC
jgi:hypothetical protein